MTVRFVKLNKDAKIPVYSSAAAAGADLCSLPGDDITILPGETVMIHTGLWKFRRAAPLLYLPEAVLHRSGDLLPQTR